MDISGKNIQTDSTFRADKSFFPLYAVINLAFTEEMYTVNEADNSVSVCVELSTVGAQAPTAAEISFQVATEDGTAEGKYETYERCSSYAVQRCRKLS